MEVRRSSISPTISPVSDINLEPGLFPVSDGSDTSFEGSGEDDGISSVLSEGLMLSGLLYKHEDNNNDVANITRINFASPGCLFKIILCLLSNI